MEYRFGDWTALAELGRGGMGVVYRVRHDDGRIAALKSLTEARPSHARSLVREIRALEGLSHPGVVQVYDSGVTDGLPWYAMELLDGRPLSVQVAETHPSTGPATASTQNWWTRTLFAEPEETPAPVEEPTGSRRHFGMDVRELLGAIQQVCWTLAWVHGEGLVHRDLKPDNIVLRTDGRAVLVDFGLAGRLGIDGREGLAEGGRGKGTRMYMAPEQFVRDRVDGRADLYSLGCMVHEVLCGRPPFSATSPAALARAHLYDPPVPVRALAPDAPEGLEALVLRLLEKDPGDRPHSALAVGEALLEWVDTRAWLDALPAPRPALLRPPRVGPVPELPEAPLVVIAGPGGVGRSRVLVDLVDQRALHEDVWIGADPDAPAGAWVFFDDVQDADAATRAWLVRHAEAGGHVVAAERTEDGPPTLPGVVVELGPLDRAGIEAQLCGCLGAERLPEELVDVVWARSGGLPGRVHPLVAGALDAGWLARDDQGGWQIRGPIPDEAVAEAPVRPDPLDPLEPMHPVVRARQLIARGRPDRAREALVDADPEDPEVQLTLAECDARTARDAAVLARLEPFVALTREQELQKQILLASALTRRDRWDEAVDRFDRSLELARELGDRAIEIRALVGQAQRHWVDESWLGEEAETRFALARQVAIDLGDPRWKALVALHYGALRSRDGRLEEATAMLEQGRLDAEESGDGTLLASILTNLGWNAMNTGELERATEWSRRAKVAHERAANPRGAAVALRNIGICYHRRGDTERAAGAYAAAGAALEAPRVLGRARRGEREPGDLCDGPRSPGGGAPSVRPVDRAEPTDRRSPDRGPRARVHRRAAGSPGPARGGRALDPHGPGPAPARRERGVRGTVAPRPLRSLPPARSVPGRRRGTGPRGGLPHGAALRLPPRARSPVPGLPRPVPRRGSTALVGARGRPGARPRRGRPGRAGGTPGRDRGPRPRRAPRARAARRRGTAVDRTPYFVGSRGPTVQRLSTTSAPA